MFLYVLYVFFAICSNYYVEMQNLVKIGQSAAEFLRIFHFQNGGRPPSWIWSIIVHLVMLSDVF